VATSTLPAEVVAAMKDPKRVFGRYILVQELGRGGMGTVWRSWQLDLKRWVAVKLLHEGESEDTLARFLREAQTASQLHHANIAAVYEVGQKDGRFFISMQYIDGTTFDRLIGRKVPRETLLKVLRAAALAVHAAHAQGVVHRDIKPSNIMLGKDGKAYVLDFGIARMAHGGDVLTLTGMVVGTPAYMAPEQASGDPDKVDRGADIWSLGVLLYEIVTGTLPFRGRSQAETLMLLTGTQATPPSQRAPDVPLELDAICMKALEKERARRYATAEELANDLGRYLKGREITAKRVTGWTRLARWLAERRIAVGVAAVVAVAALAAGAVWASKRSSERAGWRAEARRLMEAGRWSDAQAAWVRLAGDAEADASMRTCRDLLSKLEAGKAQTDIRQKAQKELAEADVLFGQARDLMQEPGAHKRLTEKLAEAEARALQATATDGTYAEAWFKLGQIRYERRDARAADAFGKDPSNPNALYFRALVNVRRVIDSAHAPSMTTASLLALADAVKADLAEANRQGLEAGRQKIGAILDAAMEGRHDDGLKLARELLEKSPEDLLLLELAGVLSRLLAKPREALPHFERLVRRRPNDPVLALRHGACVFAADPAKGVELMKAALAVEPKDVRLQREYAREFLQVGRFADALPALEAIVASDPANHPARYDLGQALWQIGRRNESEVHFKRVIADGEEAVDDLLYLDCYFRTNDFLVLLDKADAFLKKLDPVSTPLRRHKAGSAHCLRAWAYAALNQMPEALKAYDQAIATDPTELRAYYAAATIMRNTKTDLPRALALVRKGLELPQPARMRESGQQLAASIESLLR